MIANLIGVTLVMISLVADQPISEGDKIELHVAGHDDAKQVSVGMFNENNNQLGVPCQRSPEGSEDGHWVCVFEALKGTWTINSVMHEDRVGEWHLWSDWGDIGKNFPIIEVGPANPVAPPDHGPNQQLFLPSVSS